MIKHFGELTHKEYVSLGFKCGLEIHQQLLTQKKLFCHCPAGLYSNKYDVEILRHMRPTLSELGEYDGTALMEFKTKKEIIYRLNNKSACTYEFDDTPPFAMNEEALDIALEIAILLQCNLVSELHISRKQYLDGSIPTGFQRTTILGVDGKIPYKNKKIRIYQLGLEEDSCREISDAGHIRIYNTDRLGMPLIETVTYPDIKDPWEAAEVAEVIRRLTRVTGKVRTGIGATRQDVNVSIKNGTRIEIKGVPRIPLIPKLVHNEAMRQKSLLEIKEKLRKKGFSNTSYKANFCDVTNILKKTKYKPIKEAIENSSLVKAILLPGFKNILSYETQPDVLFEQEISDRVRVIACLDTMPNIISTETRGANLSHTEWEKITTQLGSKNQDAIVIVWGNKQDSETGMKEIEIRAKEAIIGIPSETRQALPNGTNGFERILPGPNRMYPDTDLPPISIADKRIKRISAVIPEPPWKKEKRYIKLKLSEDVIALLVVSKYSKLFDKIVNDLKVAPVLVGVTIIQRLKHLRRKGVNINKISDAQIYQMFEAYKKNRFSKEIIPALLEKIATLSDKKSTVHYELGFEKAYKKLKINPISIKELQIEIKNAYKTYAKVLYKSKVNMRPRMERFLMGKIMNKVIGKVDGKTVRNELKKILNNYGR